MIKKIERIIKLYSLEKDGKVYHLIFDFEDKRKFAKLKKKYTVVEHSLVMEEKVYVPTDREMLKYVNRRLVHKDSKSKRISKQHQ